MTVEQKAEVGGDMPGWHEVSGPKCEVTHKSLRYIHLYNMKRVVKTDGDIHVVVYPTKVSSVFSADGKEFALIGQAVWFLLQSAKVRNVVQLSFRHSSE